MLPVLHCACLAGLILYFVRGRDGTWTAIAQYAVSSIAEEDTSGETGARPSDGAISALVPTSDGSLAVAAGKDLLVLKDSLSI
jgi:hypothetical protein